MRAARGRAQWAVGAGRAPMIQIHGLMDSLIRAMAFRQPAHVPERLRTNAHRPVIAQATQRGDDQRPAVPCVAVRTKLEVTAGSGDKEIAISIRDASFVGKLGALVGRVELAPVPGTRRVMQERSSRELQVFLSLVAISNALPVWPSKRKPAAVSSRPMLAVVCATCFRVRSTCSVGDGPLWRCVEPLGCGAGSNATPTPRACHAPPKRRNASMQIISVDGITLSASGPLVSGDSVSTSSSRWRRFR